MNRYAHVLLVCVLVLSALVSTATALATGSYVNGAALTPETDEAARREQVVDLYGKLPLTFVENKGQLDEQVSFQARSPSATVWFTASSTRSFHDSPICT